MSVEVYFVRESSQVPTVGPIYRLPLADCVRRLGLQRKQRVPWDKNGRSSESSHAGLQVVCKIDDSEAMAAGWVPGLYQVGMTAAQAVDAIGDHPSPL